MKWKGNEFMEIYNIEKLIISFKLRNIEVIYFETLEYAKNEILALILTEM